MPGQGWVGPAEPAVGPWLDVGSGTDDGETDDDGLTAGKPVGGVGGLESGAPYPPPD